MIDESKNINQLTKVTDFTDELNRIVSSRNGSTVDGAIVTKELIDYIISQVPGFNTAASGLPSTSGAGNINMSRANDYYSESAITGDVTWGLTNIVIDKAVSIDVKADGNAINLVQAGVTFKGAVIAGVVQGLDASESNLIAIWAQTATIMWVTVILNEV